MEYVYLIFCIFVGSFIIASLLSGLGLQRAAIYGNDISLKVEKAIMFFLGLCTLAWTVLVVHGIACFIGILEEWIPRFF